PIAGQLCDLLERAWLFEQVCGAGNDLHAFFHTQLAESILIQTNDRFVRSSNDQEGGGLHVRQRRAGQIGAPAARYDSADPLWFLTSRDKRGSRAGTGAEIPDCQALRIWIIAHPFSRAGQAVRQKINIESQMTRTQVDLLLIRS